MNIFFGRPHFVPLDSGSMSRLFTAPPIASEANTNTSYVLGPYCFENGCDYHGRRLNGGCLIVELRG
jgi:hypothetical protein